jgi:uncharacterized membrane protein
MNAHFSILAMFAVLMFLGAVATFSLWTSRVNSFFFFGRTVPAEFRGTPGAQRITRRYLGCILISFGLADVLFVLLYQHYGRSVYAAMIAALLAQVVLQNVSFAIAHGSAGRELARLSVEEPAYAARGGVVSIPLQPAAALLSLAAMLAPAVAAACLWGAATLLSRDGLEGFTNRAASGNGAGLFGMALGVLFSATALLLLRYSSRHRTRMAHYMVRILLVLDWCGTLITGAVAFAALTHHAVGKAESHFVLFFLLGILAAHIVYAWSRQRAFAPAAVEQNGDRHWRLGMYYCNRQDPALFIQNRCGPGYTLNFGNVYAWPIALLVLGDFVFLALRHGHL